MKVKEILSAGITKKIVCLIMLLAIAILSIFVISKPATSPESYRSTIESIDEKKATVMGVTATAAAASTALAAIPSDATTPVANQIMEISEYLFIVVCVLALEKSLLTVMGYLSFNILIPVACALLGVYTFIKKETLKILAVKFVVFALVIVAIIPFSLKISDMIYDMSRSTIEQVTTEVDENVVEETPSENKSWWENTIDKIKEGATDVAEKAKQILNSFIDAIAMFVIIYCAIPIIVVFLVIWFIKFLFGIAIPMPTGIKTPLFKNKFGKKTMELKAD